MTNRKKKTVTQLGKQPPQYRFFLNPYPDVRFTRCPQCDSKMHQRKLPLMIHVEPMHMLSLNKTCRYCPHCDLLITHQNDVEHFLASFFMEQEPEVIGNDYLVIGTLEKTTWKRGMQQLLTLQEILEALHDFKEVVTFKMTGGWMRDETKSAATASGETRYVSPEAIADVFETLKEEIGISSLRGTFVSIRFNKTIA